MANTAAAAVVVMQHLLIEFAAAKTIEFGLFSNPNLSLVGYRVGVAYVAPLAPLLTKALIIKAFRLRTTKLITECLRQSSDPSHRYRES